MLTLYISCLFIVLYESCQYLFVNDFYFSQALQYLHIVSSANHIINIYTLQVVQHCLRLILLILLQVTFDSTNTNTNSSTNDDDNIQNM